MVQSICRVDELVDRQCREFVLQQGGESLPAFLLRLGDEVVAYRNRCPHTGAPLNWNPHEFLTVESDFIQCAIHGARFRMGDSYCVHGPCIGKALLSIPLIVEAGVISLKAD
jgi:nitrite reductase/ring-hydroxylating ferredoxin subunit